MDRISLRTQLVTGIQLFLRAHLVHQLKVRLASEDCKPQGDHGLTPECSPPLAERVPLRLLAPCLAGIRAPSASPSASCSSPGLHWLPEPSRHTLDSKGMARQEAACHVISVPSAVPHGYNEYYTLLPRFTGQDLVPCQLLKARDTWEYSLISGG